MKTKGVDSWRWFITVCPIISYMYIYNIYKTHMRRYAYMERVRRSFYVRIVYHNSYVQYIRSRWITCVASSVKLEQTVMSDIACIDEFSSCTLVISWPFCRTDTQTPKIILKMYQNFSPSKTNTKDLCIFRKSPKI